MGWSQCRRPLRLLDWTEAVKGLEAASSGLLSSDGSAVSHNRRIILQQLLCPAGSQPALDRKDLLHVTEPYLLLDLILRFHFISFMWIWLTSIMWFYPKYHATIGAVSQISQNHMYTVNSNFPRSFYFIFYFATIFKWNSKLYFICHKKCSLYLCFTFWSFYIHIYFCIVF